MRKVQIVIAIIIMPGTNYHLRICLPPEWCMKMYTQNTPMRIENHFNSFYVSNVNEYLQRTCGDIIRHHWISSLCQFKIKQHLRNSFKGFFEEFFFLRAERNMHHAERETVGPLKCFKCQTWFHFILASNSTKTGLIIQHFFTQWA